MTKYHRLDLPKMTVFLTSGELAILLQKDMDLFKRGLQRGKMFGRCESKSAQYEKKFANHESEILNKHLQ